MKTEDFGSYITEAKRILAEKPYNVDMVESLEETVRTAENADSVLKSETDSDIIEESISENEVTDDEVHTRRDISEDGRMHDKSETAGNSGTVLQGRDRVDDSERRISSAERSGHRAVEERSIQEVVETDKFKKLSTTVVSEILHSKNKDLYDKYRTDERWDEEYTAEERAGLKAELSRMSAH